MFKSNKLNLNFKRTIKVYFLIIKMFIKINLLKKYKNQSAEIDFKNLKNLHLNGYL